MFRKRNKDAQTVAVVLLEDACVRVGYVRYPNSASDDHSLPCILYSAKDQISLSQSESPTRNLAALLKVMKSLVAEMEQKYHAKPRHVYCTLPTHLTLHQVSLAQKRADNPFEITRDLLSELYDSAAVKIEGTEIENLMVDVKINGYRTSSPLGKSGTTISLARYVSSADASDVSKIREALIESFHHDDYSLHTYPQALRSVVQKCFAADLDYLVVDIGGEITEVTLVESGVLSAHTTFPLGTRSHIRSLSNQMAIQAEGVSSALSIDKAKLTDARSVSKLTSLTKSAMVPWQEAYAAARSRLAESREVLPRSLFLLCNDDMREQVIDVIQSASPDNPHAIQPITNAALSQFTESAKGTARDLFLMLLVVYYDIVRKQPKL